MKGVLDSRAAWITASAALAIMTIAYGAPLVVVVAMKQIAAELQANRSGPAGAGSLSYVGAAFGGIVAGWLAGRLGIRPIVIFGSTMVALGLLLSSFGGMLELYLGHGISVTGRIDAIFEGEDGTWEVIDYKTGKNDPDPLQLALYACAVEEIWGRDAVCAWLLLRTGDERPAPGVNDFEAIVQSATQRLTEISAPSDLGAAER